MYNDVNFIYLYGELANCYAYSYNVHVCCVICLSEIIDQSSH